MSHTQRTTRECTLDELRPELAEAVRAYAQRQQWPNLETEVVACCETTSERISSNRLDAWLNGGAISLSYLALVATPDRLIWAFSGEASSPGAASAGAASAGAASAPFKQMRLKIFTPKTTAGIAVEIFARMDGSRDKTGGRFMLDDSPAARHFAEEIKRITDPLYTPERPRRKWFGR
jgi:hypothetical protein